MLGAPAVCWGEDTVLVRMPSGRGQQRLTGEIREFNGRELVLVRSTGREERLPTERVIEIQATWQPSHVQAEQAMTEARFADAIVLWRQAIAAEPRAWARRRGVARLVRCYSQERQDDAAGDLFAALVESDPDTQYFDVIPLSWGASTPQPGLEAKAAAWLTHSREVMQLIGASWLLSSPRRQEAITNLRRLAGSSDSRVALLATAQLWRVESATATAADLARWAALLDRIPPALRGGPYFVLGDALARQQQFDQAALHLMRVPIQYAQQRGLAAESLWMTARLLEKQQRAAEARTLYREIVTSYPEASCAAQAQARLDELDRPAPPPKA